MIDTRDLLGKLFQSNVSPSSQERVGHALGAQGAGRPEGTGSTGGAGESPLASMLGDLLGPGGKLGGVTQQAEGLFGTARQRIESGDPMAIGGLGALAGLLLGGRGGAVGTGALAFLGSLAYGAIKKSQAAAASGAGAAQATPAALADELPLGVRPPQTPQEETELQNTALLVIRAMVNAAKADGQIDGGEMSRIMGKLKEAGADDEAQRFMISEMQKPFDADALIEDVHKLGKPEVAVEVYAASLLAIEVDTPAEREYLAQLASKLGIPADAVKQVHDALGVPQP